MRWRDFSLRKRLWLANLLMIVVPLCALLGLGSLLIGILHLADADHLGPLSLLWPFPDFSLPSSSPHCSATPPGTTPMSTPPKHA